jgi:hypothetical protein
LTAAVTPTFRTAGRSSSALALGLAAALLATGCTPTASPAPNASAPTSAIVPEPGRTLEAVPDDGTIDLAGTSLAIVATDGPVSATMLEGARAFVERTGATATEFVVSAGDDAAMDAAFAAAAEAGADVVVGLGDDVVDVFSFETAQRLDQQFLVVGAQIAEPTANVTAVVWQGATSRGAAAAADGDLDDETVTVPRTVDALAAGMTSIRDDVPGVVLWTGSL